jgi:CRISPR/Cas system type I-B associated protein Csh2 (Cas7 group RAMP superfamily)
MHAYLHARKFCSGTKMANDDTSSNPKGSITVRIGPELLQRVNRVIYFLHKSQTDFVKEALAEKTKEYEEKHPELSAAVKIEQKILERENRVRR